MDSQPTLVIAPSTTVTDTTGQPLASPAATLFDPAAVTGLTWYVVPAEASPHRHAA